MSDDSSAEGSNSESASCECINSDADTKNHGDTSKSKSKKSRRRREFKKEEDRAIIDYITGGERYLLTGGISVWKDAVTENICPGRSFWSLKERFRRHILPNLGIYKLNEDVKRKLKKEKNDEENDEKPSASTTENDQKEYTKKEDEALIKFFSDNFQRFATSGHKVWKLAEEEKICPGRSFWSMRERFIKFIVPNIESYKCDERYKAAVTKAVNDPYGRFLEMPRNYITEEDIAIIKFVTHADRYVHINGLTIWKEAEEGRICPGRSYWSMKERFKKVILPNLDRYTLDDKQKEKLNFLASASADEIAAKRELIHVKEVLRSKSRGKSPGSDSDLSDNSPYFKQTSRFHYPALKNQRALESPMGRTSEISTVKKKPSPNKSNQRNNLPEQCCSKDLSPIKKPTNLGKRKAVNSSPKKTDESASRKKSKEDKSPVKVAPVESDSEESSDSSEEDNMREKSRRIALIKKSSPKKANENASNKAKGAKSPVKDKAVESDSEDTSDSSWEDNKRAKSRRIITPVKKSSPKKADEIVPKKNVKGAKSPVKVTAAETDPEETSDSSGEDNPRAKSRRVSPAKKSSPKKADGKGVKGAKSPVKAVNDAGDTSDSSVEEITRAKSLRVSPAKNSPKKDKSPFKSPENDSSDLSVDASSKRKSRKIIPFFEEMNKDSLKKKIVASTPKKVPDTNSSKQQNNSSVKTTKTTPKKKTTGVGSKSVSEVKFLINKLRSARSKV